MTSSSLTISSALHPRVHEALIHPQKSLEMRGWLKTNAKTALSWRGEDGETMMHWAFLSDWVWACELRDVGLSFDDTDNIGRTPMDWLNDRLWSAVVEPMGLHRLSAGGQERLRKHTEDQVQALWLQGARPGNVSGAIHPGVAWIRAGAWSLLPLLSDWTHWTPRRGSALHAWVLSPNTPGRRHFLSEWVKNQSVDVRDQDGRTPLWYAVDAWLTKADWRPSLLSVISELVGANADPHSDDIDGASPLSLIWRSDDADTPAATALLEILSTAE